MACNQYLKSIVLLDVEGTTTPLNFVHGILFPYAERNMESFLNSMPRGQEVSGCISDLEAFRKENKMDSGENLLNFIRKCMKQDLKIGPLKTLQGLIWERGYRSGELKGEVYDDVPGAMKRWTSSGKKIYIYSSGSVLAQKMIYRYSSGGDLSRFITGYFDTSAGPKKESSSYSRISHMIGVDSGNMSFLTDSPEELRAANQAGFHAIRVDRDGTMVEGKENEDIVHDFRELC
ncbi:MAG: acireductone synthase [Cuniculiplasma sp.]